MTVTELIAAAKRFKPTAEDVRRLVATCEKVDQEQQARGWKPGEYSAWLNKPFSSL